MKIDGARDVCSQKSYHIKYIYIINLLIHKKIKKTQRLYIEEISPFILQNIQIIEK